MMKLDLAKISGLWKFEIVSSMDDDVVLKFPDLMVASAFISSSQISDAARLTFPGNVTDFMTPVLVTVSRYTEFFQEV